MTIRHEKERAMTVILPFHVPQEKRRPFREGTGSAYYGPALRAVIAPPPKPSPIERLDDWYQRNWIAVFVWSLVACFAAGIGYGIAR